MKRVLVIGAGASGMMAAIQASQKGAEVTIYEKTDRVGKKILSTGNGKCNLSNRDMDLANYYTTDKKKMAACLSRFSVDDTVSFFEEIGLLIRNRENFLYPYCEQASAVLDVLRSALVRNNINVKTDISDITFSVKKNGKFVVYSSIGKGEFDAVILACGSKAGIKNANTQGYDYAKYFGHRIVDLLPALVQVRCEGDYFKAIAGVRAKANIQFYSNGKFLAEEKGELQLTDYGISGIPVFQISRVIAKELHNKNKLKVSIDFVPEIASGDWGNFINNRIDNYKSFTLEDFLTGMLHKKISLMLLKKYELKPQDILDCNNEEKVKALCLEMKGFEVIPASVNTFEQAQVCSGGVDFAELTDNLESVYQPGLFICGEMVDVDGKCGGYNLQWAWTSGYIAGVSAAER